MRRSITLLLAASTVTLDGAFLRWCAGVLLASALSACGGGASGSDVAGLTPSVGATSAANATARSAQRAQPPDAKSKAASNPTLIAQPPDLVNTTTAGDQQVRAIGDLADGGYEVVWVSGEALFLQRYGAAGNKIGGETAVQLVFDPRDVASQILANSAVAVLADGSVVVAYPTGRTSGGGMEPVQTAYTVSIQRFDASGVQILPETQVVSVVGGDPRRPTTFGNVQVLAMADGGHVVGWTRFSASATVGSRDALQTQRFDADNQPAGGVVSIGSVVGPSFFRIAGDSTGGYTAYWSGLREDFTPTGLTVTHYDQNQSPTQVLAGFLGSALLLPLEGEGFFLYTVDTNLNAFRQMLDSHGAPVGESVAVSTLPFDARQLADGTLIVFESAPSGGLLAQRYTAAGEPIGDLLTLQTSGTTRLLAARADSGFVVAWNNSSETTGLDVYVQAFTEATSTQRKACLDAAKGLHGHERQAFMAACLAR